MMYQHLLRVLYKGTKLSPGEQEFKLFGEAHRSRLLLRFKKMHKRQEELLIYRQPGDKPSYSENLMTDTYEDYLSYKEAFYVQKGLRQPDIQRLEGLALGTEPAFNSRLEVDFNNKFYDVLESIKDSFLLN